MKIVISESVEVENGFMFDIWLNADLSDTESPDDGGLCIGTYEDVVDTACELAKDLIARKTN